jgi:hypothetical protein
MADEHGVFVNPNGTERFNEKETLGATVISDDGTSTHSHDHIFKDEAIAKYWRNVYEENKYESRHRFDPNYTWTPEEEKKLVRKVEVSCDQSMETYTHVNLDRPKNYVLGLAHVLRPRSEPQEYQSCNFGQYAA